MKVKNITAVSAMCALVVLGACATRPANLAPNVEVATDSFSGKFDVAVSGSKERIVKNADIESAVKSAITDAKLFSGDAATSYDVAVQVLSIENPLAGVDLTSSVRAKWTLKKRGDGATSWTESITSSETAKFSESIIAAQRLRLANERAISANIELGVKWLADVAKNPSEE